MQKSLGVFPNPFRFLIAFSFSHTLGIQKIFLIFQCPIQKVKKLMKDYAMFKMKKNNNLPAIAPYCL